MGRRPRTRSLADVAAELGVPRRELRAWLQRTYPRDAAERGRAWRLDDAQVAAARVRWGGARRRSRRRVAVRVAAAAAAVVLVALGLVAAAAYWQAEAFVAELQAGEKRAVVDAARPELDVPPRRPAVPVEPGPAQTILLVGSDARAADPDDRRSDTIMLVRLDPADRRISLLSVPRDLLVEVPGHGPNRVNVAYERGGIALLTATLRETLGVEINHFFEVDFGGFRRLVAELGGVYLPVDGRYFNRNVGTAETNFAEIDLRPGYQRLDGRQALAWVRYRHGDSDLIRAARQQLFLREAGRQVAEARLHVLRLRRLLERFAEATTSDVDEVRALWRILRTVEETPSSRVERHTIPAVEAIVGDAYYVTAREEQLHAAVVRWLGAPPEPAATPRPPAAPAPAAAPVLVPDGGRGSQLVADGARLLPCRPTALPQGFSWPDADAARTYELAGRPAAALWATRGSGRSVLWSATTWDDVPALRAPTSTVDRGARTYALWFENRRLRQVAWEEDGVHVWITNTLRNELAVPAMLALADSCR